MMLNFRHIGDWNPQLLRELKSRLNWRNGSIAMAVSVVGQLLLLLSHFSKLPGNSQAKYIDSGYCLSPQCATDSFGNVLVNWPKLWTNVAVNISWLMFLGLFVGGVYSLSSSFSQEEKRGTLDFIRLTPQKASTILLGKLFGVPILVYLGTALALPLQFYAVDQGNISLIHVLSWDFLMLAVAFMLYLGAMLATMWFKAQSILLAAVALLAAHPVISLGFYWSDRSYLNIYSRVAVEWYGIVPGNRLSYYLVFTGLAIAGIYWLYQALERRYLQPQSTILSKGQSYLWSLTFHLFVMGFFFSNYSYGDGAKNRLLFHVPFNFGRGNSSSGFGEVVLVTFGLFWLLLLVPVLLPSRQSLVEWSRHGSAKTHWLRSLVWDDKSPAVLAVAINMAIISMAWLIASALSPNRSSLPKMLLGCLITMTLVTIYSSIAHWVLFWPVNNRPAWITGIVGGLVFLPLIGAVFIPWSKDFLYLVSPFLWNSIRSTPFFGVLFIWGIQLTVLAWLTMRLRKVLTKVGRSESYQHFVA
jgi:ABC-type transport system involved in cytochrome c biogenesis permease component